MASAIIIKDKKTALEQLTALCLQQGYQYVSSSACMSTVSAFHSPDTASQDYLILRLNEAGSNVIYIEINAFLSGIRHPQTEEQIALHLDSL